MAKRCDHNVCFSSRVLECEADILTESELYDTLKDEVDKDENEEYHDFVRVRCSQCDCRSGSVKYNATIHGIDGEYVEVAQKWNRRVCDEN